jgi:5-formyltetrahydrofolate cyclo-ligase
MVPRKAALPTAEASATTPNLSSRAGILSWRKAQRNHLIAERLAINGVDRRRHAVQIAIHLTKFVDSLPGRSVSFYWPFRGEPDLRPFMQTLWDRGERCALPVVVEKNAPLVFRLWQPGCKLVPGIWNIPVPADSVEIEPDIVIAPVVGFDSACYRLGYGGGFFDRTLAILSTCPVAIGVGYAQAALASIYPLPHDIPMDVVVTEHGLTRPNGTIAQKPRTSIWPMRCGLVPGSTSHEHHTLSPEE